MKDTLGARVGLFRLELASTCAGHIQETCCYWADVQRKGKGLGEERSLSLSLWSFPTRLGLSSCLGKQIDHPQCHMQRNHLHEYRRNPARVSAHVIKKMLKVKQRDAWPETRLSKVATALRGTTRFQCLRPHRVLFLSTYRKMTPWQAEEKNLKLDLF